MKTIDNNPKEHYIDRQELNLLSFSNPNWLDMFKEGEILHVIEGNGHTTHMVVEVKKQLNFLK